MKGRVRFYETISVMGELASKNVRTLLALIGSAAAVALLSGSALRVLVVLMVLALVVGLLPIFVQYYIGYLARRLRRRHKYWN